MNKKNTIQEMTLIFQALSFTKKGIKSKIWKNIVEVYFMWYICASWNASVEAWGAPKFGLVWFKMARDMIQDIIKNWIGIIWKDGLFSNKYNLTSEISPLVENVFDIISRFQQQSEKCYSCYANKRTQKKDYVNKKNIYIYIHIKAINTKKFHFTPGRSSCATISIRGRKISLQK